MKLGEGERREGMVSVIVNVSYELKTLNTVRDIQTCTTQLGT